MAIHCLYDSAGLDGQLERWKKDQCFILRLAFVLVHNLGPFGPSEDCIISLIDSSTVPWQPSHGWR